MAEDFFKRVLATRPEFERLIERGKLQSHILKELEDQKEVHLSEETARLNTKAAGIEAEKCSALQRLKELAQQETDLAEEQRVFLAGEDKRSRWFHEKTVEAKGRLNNVNSLLQDGFASFARASIAATTEDVSTISRPSPPPSQSPTLPEADSSATSDAPLLLSEGIEQSAASGDASVNNAGDQAHTVVVETSKWSASWRPSPSTMTPQKTPRKTPSREPKPTEPIHARFPTVLFHEGDWYDASCHFCGANASDKDNLFQGLDGLTDHYRRVHAYTNTQIQDLPRVDKRKKLGKAVVQSMKEGRMPEDHQIEAQPEVGVDGIAEISELGEAISEHYQGVRKHGERWYEVICAECGCNANTTTFEYLTPAGVRDHFRHVHNSDPKVAFYRLRLVSTRDAAAMQVGEWPVDTPINPKIGFHLRGSYSRPFNGRIDSDNDSIFAPSPSRKQVKRSIDGGITPQHQDPPSKKRRETEEHAIAPKEDPKSKALRWLDAVRKHTVKSK